VASRHLSWAFASLQHSRVRKSTAYGCAAPAAFRPQGLATLTTAYSFRARAGFVSHQRRSWDLPFGASSSRKVAARFRVTGPTYRFSCRCYRHRGGGPARQAAVPGLSPLRESLAARAVLGRQPLAAPLGFTLPGSANRSLGRDFARPPLSRFHGRFRRTAAGASEFRSASAWSGPTTTASRERQTEQPS